MEFDKANGYLYVQQNIGGGGRSVISVFKVNPTAGDDTLPPAPPTNLITN